MTKSTKKELSPRQREELFTALKAGLKRTWPGIKALSGQSERTKDDYGESQQAGSR